MAWQQPKTDWKESDYFNVEDYNRIKGNLNELHRMALVYWEECFFELFFNYGSTSFTNG